MWDYKRSPDGFIRPELGAGRCGWFAEKEGNVGAKWKLLDLLESFECLRVLSIGRMLGESFG